MTAELIIDGKKVADVNDVKIKYPYPFKKEFPGPDHPLPSHVDIHVRLSSEYTEIQKFFNYLLTVPPEMNLYIRQCIEKYGIPMVEKESEENLPVKFSNGGQNGL